MKEIEAAVLAYIAPGHRAIVREPANRLATAIVRALSAGTSVNAIEKRLLKYLDKRTVDAFLKPDEPEDDDGDNH